MRRDIAAETAKIESLHRRMSEEHTAAELLAWLAPPAYPAALTVLLDQAAASRCGILWLASEGGMHQNRIHSMLLHSV